MEIQNKEYNKLGDVIEEMTNAVMKKDMENEIGRAHV